MQIPRSSRVRMHWMEGSVINDLTRLPVEGHKVSFFCYLPLLKVSFSAPTQMKVVVIRLLKIKHSCLSGACIYTDVEATHMT